MKAQAFHERKVSIVGTSLRNPVSERRGFRPRLLSCAKRLSRTQHHPLKSSRSLATRWNDYMAYHTCLPRSSMISAMTYPMYHAYCSRMPVTGGRHSNMILPLPSRTVLRPPGLLVQHKCMHVSRL